MSDKNSNSYKNYRVEPSEVAFKIYATNTETGREELIRCMLNKGRACAYVARMNNPKKHKILSNRLRIVMHEKNISAEELASKVRMAKNTIRSYMRNNLQPSYGTLIYLADTLGVKPQELINF